jgi:hypothetical protein
MRSSEVLGAIQRTWTRGQLMLYSATSSLKKPIGDEWLSLRINDLLVV